MNDFPKNHIFQQPTWWNFWESGSRRQRVKAAEAAEINVQEMRREIHAAADDVDADIAPGNL